MADENPDILREAIARNLGVVLSLPSAGMLRHCKSRFLAMVEDGSGFWLESAPEERPLVQSLISSKQPVGIAFKSNAKKVVFLTPALKLEQEYRINAETVVEALLVQFPETVKAIQRRANYRVRVLPDYEFSCKIWRIGERAYLKDRPMAAAEMPVSLHDLSIGGLGVTFLKKDGQSPRISPEDRLRIQLCYKDSCFLVEGRMRTAIRETNDGLRSGIQFKALENNLEGRQTLAQLTKVVGELQRDEVRRHRMGIA